MTGLADEEQIAPSFYDGWKRVFLEKPMITDDLQHEKLSNTVALGALSPDAISSTAYGPEQITVELLPAAGCWQAASRPVENPTPPQKPRWQRRSSETPTGQTAGVI